MDSEKIQNHISSTYFNLRVGIALLSIAFPIILWIVGLIKGIQIQDSMSSYYYAIGSSSSMRDYFVGILFAVGVFLYLYKGYTTVENIFLNLAGIFALLIALFPRYWGCKPDCSSISPHGICAISFFICIAIVAIFFASNSLNLLSNPIRERKLLIIYRSLGCLMVVLPMCALLLQYFISDFPYTFVAEALAIWVFSIYWIVKSYEFRIISSKCRADGV